MAGFVEEVKPISECLDIVSEALRFPWEVRSKKTELFEAAFSRSSTDILSVEDNPCFTRSLRDGYAVDHRFTAGASQGAPVFLRLSGEIAMGNTPDFTVGAEEAASIATGGMMPRGTDAVVMLEDTDPAGSWIEVRRAVQRGENLITAGEDIARGGIIARRGELIDPAIVGMLSTVGMQEVDVTDLRIGIISTGDEIVPVNTNPLPLGRIRDANSGMMLSLLKQYGFLSDFLGIVSDNGGDLDAVVGDALKEYDVLLISGGSSVGARDNSTAVMSALPDPGLIIRGINMVPGKPTLIAGSLAEQKLVVGLPGHPTSCSVACIFVLLPLLLRLIGAHNCKIGRYISLPLAVDIHGRTGPDEFIPMTIESGLAKPLAAKSGYVSALRGIDGFIRLLPENETLRKGEEASVWLW